MADFLWRLLEKVRTYYEQNPDSDWLPAPLGGAGKNPQSAFGGQQAGKNSLETDTPKTPFLFARLFWQAGENFENNDLFYF